MTVKVTGVITNYQIAPNPNSGLITIERGDDAYNAVAFSNTGAVEVNDKLTNRSGAVLSNSGQLVTRGGTFLNLGLVVNNSGITTEVDSLLRNEGEIKGYGNIANKSAFENHGIVRIEDIGYHTNAPGATMVNGSSGLIHIGPVGTLDDRGSFFNKGLLQIDGEFQAGPYLGGAFGLQNSGKISISKDGKVIMPEGGGMQNLGQVVVAGLLENRGFLRNGDFGIIDVLSGGTLRNSGLLANYSVIMDVEKGGSIEGGGEFRNTGLTTSTLNVRGRVDQREVDNGGSIRIYSTGFLHADKYQQTWDDAVTVVNGVLSSSDLRIDAGIVKGTGSIFSNVYMGKAGKFAPGLSPGDLTIEGSVQMAGTLDLEISEEAFDRLIFNSMEFLPGSQVHFIFLNDYAPTDQWFSLYDFLIGEFSGWEQVATFFDGLPSTHDAFWDGTNFQVRQVSDPGPGPNPVPEPDPWALLLLGMAFVVFAVRRNRHTPARSRC